MMCCGFFFLLLLLSVKETFSHSHLLLIRINQHMISINGNIVLWQCPCYSAKLLRLIGRWPPLAGDLLLCTAA